jgi:hypothetical protein
MCARKRDLRKLANGTKNTLYVKTGCCVFVASKRNIVTVLKEITKS